MSLGVHFALSPEDASLIRDCVYTACLVSTDQVGEVCAALRGVTREWMRERYQTLDLTDYAGSLSEDDFEYTWENFEGLRAFFEKALAARRVVLFTTDAG